MYEALLVVFLIVAIALVALIMLQQGKGADMGASFRSRRFRYAVRFKWFCELHDPYDGDSGYAVLHHQSGAGQYQQQQDQ